jgi:hypothetical protein
MPACFIHPGAAGTCAASWDCLRTRLLVYAGRYQEKNIPLLPGQWRCWGRYHLLLVGGGERRRAAANITVWPYRRESAELAMVLASADALSMPALPRPSAGGAGGHGLWTTGDRHCAGACPNWLMKPWA